MLDMAGELGFTVRPDPEDSDVLLWPSRPAVAFLDQRSTVLK